jgi:magnesium transporter
MGGNYLVTIHKLPVPELDEAHHRWAQNLEEIDRGIGILLYSLLDAMVDNYFPVLDTLAEHLEKLEDTIYEENSDGNVADLLSVKRDLLRLRRVLAPERDVLNVLTRRDTPIFNRRTMEYFLDIYDHILRITEAIDNFRDLASSALDARLSVSSNNLNKVMRTMTAASIILMSDALISGIYGMNFDNIPELHWEYGYFGVLVLMLVNSVGLLIFFKKRGWF